MTGRAEQMRGRTLLANGFHMPERGRVDELNGALISVGEDGSITSVLRRGDPAGEKLLREVRQSGSLVELPEGFYLLPGLVDLHVHAPQYPQLGQALDVPLEAWLNRYTFPLEARYADAGFAERNYGLLVSDLLANGTTTALYYATIHQEATRILADICMRRGQRALIGKVAMDHKDLCPDYYRDSSADVSIRGTADFIDYVRAHADNGDGRVNPVVTPRFIPSCTDAALEGLGAVAKELGCHVQTHCSESDWEHAHVLQRCGASDSESLDRFGLLGRRSVLGHATHVSSGDLDLIKARGSAISHCPISNAYFSNAVFPLRLALERGVHVGLGTDISGGLSGSLFDNMRAAVTVSRIGETGTDASIPPLERSTRPNSRIDFRDAFYIATTGGGISLDLPIGHFSAGYQFDAIAIDSRAPEGTLRLWDDLDCGEGILQKIVLTASKPNIAAVWVGGAQVA